MRKSLILAGFCLAAASTNPAQGQQTPQQYGFQLHADALIRQEWTRDIFVSPTDTRDESRRRFQLRPRVEMSARQFLFVVGGDFNYSGQKNFDPVPTLLRDNYDSRDARLDLAFLSIMPSQNIQLQGGRMFMPVPFTEMIWDKDLRPQGASLTLRALDAGGNTKFGVTVLGARGSHVFDDNDTEMVVASATIGAQAGIRSRFELTGSYIRYDKIESIPTFLRRQNTRTALGDFSNAYHVVDIVGRLRSGGSFPTQLIADYCWNTEVEEQKKGLWLSAVAGSLDQTPIRAEYTFAQVDRDATLAAYNSDDFFWGTGWEGHRIDLGLRAGAKSEIHGIGQLQRFKDSANVDERDHWVKRFRLEIRYNY